VRRLRRCAASLGLAAGLAGSTVLGLAVMATVSAALLASDVPSALAAPDSGSSAARPSGDRVASDDRSASGVTVGSVSPSTTTPGSRVTFAVSCASADTSSATLFGQTLGLPEQIPMNAGDADGDFAVTVTLPAGIDPGVYHPDIDCSDGTSTSVRLRVTEFPAAGGAQTGDGTTSTTTNTGLSAAGLVLIAVGAVAGGIAVRRRSAGRSAGPRA